MPDRPKPIPAAGKSNDITLFVGLAVVVLFFAASGFVAYYNTRTLNRNAALVRQTHETLAALDDILSLVKDAETGQRGFVITGDEAYLEPHTRAIEEITGRFQSLEQRFTDVEEQAHVRELKALIALKFRELDETIALRRTRGFEVARVAVATDRGKAAMDRIRSHVAALEAVERDQRNRRIEEMDKAFELAISSGVLTGLLGVGLSAAVATLVRRSILAQRRREWLQTGQVGLSTAMVGDRRIEQLGESVLKFLAEYLGAHAGAMFAAEQGAFRRVATYGVPVAGGTAERFSLGDGLLGQAAKDNRTFILRDVPDGYLAIGSAFGRGTPRHLLVAPLTADGNVNAMIELGFVHPVDGRVTGLFEEVSESAGMAVRAATYRASLQDFLEETQRQAEELQAQGEELRVSNEELEEQGRALRESQGRLEQQQVELEQTNAQLEGQAALLEVERDSATRARQSVQAQAQELERASRYKSDFLANMSHELRTPLNSSLILSKLLADNATGNLTAEQVQFAQTIQAAGNDLLTLINDILDLSKIEAGHMEVHAESVLIADIVESLGRTFRPVAEQKKLEFRTRIDPGCPDAIETDRQRVEQVLKNLLSNAIKFTEQGEVELSVGRTTDGLVSFAVRDTGIGIPEDQQAVVFEAFRQADAKANRKYGGTGLGLSISRELSRLLSGTLSLTSELGRGSTFTVTLPAAYDAARVRSSQRPVPAVAVAKSAAIPIPPARQPVPAFEPIKSPRRVEDDRERMTGERRVILAVEDDEAFARIIYDLAHELNFNCLIATTAEEGLATAIQHRPSAVILDVGLPDNSGLSVLDRLKQDSRTRHIPVHVVSAGDYAQTALSLGAIGYMLKPVKREELVQALDQLENRLDHRLRRVLIVEDDAVQLHSLRKLLAAHDVETAGAATAAECLEQLKATTYDCMVLDLSLPDSSGYTLLETLSREDAYAFPPVIVYTGRELSADEEQRLRRYSKSIIIKGAKSPERLLDEVTLFLHQVVSEMPPEQQKMLEKARSRDTALEGRRILVAEDDVRNVFALTSILEPRGASVQVARNGREAIVALEKSLGDPARKIDLVLMDVMMPEMDGITATREIRSRDEWRRLPIIALTAKAMKDDQDLCLSAGANDYMAKPLDVEKLLSLVRVWMPRS
ncbi:response regulator [Limnoglobus roseus]|uniref:histidine kinase n=1 Tax=Limnoglobus roseus TaxID=2598579 RepID=A0A5C1ALX9_9BACT|nr:response regulator [Limnoglobus roseus]QEL20221.1 histidine kinase [Limnoglobus roseus]